MKISRRELIKMMTVAGAAGLISPRFVFAQTPTSGKIKNFVHVFLYGGADARYFMPYIDGPLSQALKEARGAAYPTGIIDAGLSQGPRTSRLGFHPSFGNLVTTAQQSGCGISIITEYGVTGNYNFSHEFAQRQFQSGSEKDPSQVEKGWAARLFDAAELVPTQVWGINEASPLHFNTDRPRPLVLSSLAQSQLVNRYHEGMTCSFCTTTADKKEDLTAAEDSALARTFISKLNAADLTNDESDIEHAIINANKQLPEISLLAKSVSDIVVDPTRFKPTGVSDSAFKNTMVDIAKVLYYANSSPLASTALKSSSKIIFAQLGGWDAHTNINGVYPGLIGVLGGALSGLISYLKDWNILNDTVILVHSEFGRTTRLNGSAGLDHASGNNALILGGRISNSVIGPEASLSEAQNKNFFTPQVPFSSVLKTILSNAGFSSEILRKAFPTRMPNEEVLPIFS
jgi:uncharacterized protein (DUF1501 family)